ncbi:hypothetical protein M3193_09705 [Sporosarcina luteola]|uniref:hypothetical protein n=1 Tax=Sporosarcina luteola TaxID=582850 RepID=UPI0020409BE2|nr:hypothetical protein [Sporosarcina luteola]MCM3744418.1 hypothetical protein [Sporosarcina luteola]
MRERYFWAALGLIAISWIANSLYAQSKQLVEPIFLDHYIETTTDEHDHHYVTLYYLANKNDHSTINYIRLGDVEGFPHGDFFYESTTAPHAIKTYRHQDLRSITVLLRTFNEKKDAQSFNEMAVFYSDGRSSTASIGEVIIHPKRYYGNDDTRALEQPSSGGSSDGSSWDTLRATVPLAIEKIAFPFNESIENRFNFTISGKQTEQPLDSIKLPIHLEKDKSVTLKMNLKEKSFVNPYEFAIRISGTTEKGKPFTNYAHYNSVPYLTQDDVNRVIEAKTGRGSVE